MQNNYLLFPLCQQQNAAISVILTPFFYSVAVHDPNCQLNVALNGSRNIFNTTTTKTTLRAAFINPTKAKQLPLQIQRDNTTK